MPKSMTSLLYPDPLSGPAAARHAAQRDQNLVQGSQNSAGLNRVAVADTLMLAMVPSWGATISFSIFMASRTTTTSPSLHSLSHGSLNRNDLAGHGSRHRDGTSGSCRELPRSGCGSRCGCGCRCRSRCGRRSQARALQVLPLRSNRSALRALPQALLLRPPQRLQRMPLPFTVIV